MKIDYEVEKLERRSEKKYGQAEWAGTPKKAEKLFDISYALHREGEKLQDKSEAILAEAERFDKRLERLKGQRARNIERYELQGWAEGERWAKSARFADLRYAAKVFKPKYLCHSDFYKDEVLGAYSGIIRR